jgi:hypothetical protein
MHRREDDRCTVAYLLKARTGEAEKQSLLGKAATIEEMSRYEM